MREAEQAGVELAELADSSFRAAHPMFARGARRELIPEVSLGNREIAGGTGPKSVASQLHAAKRILNSRA